MSSYADKQPHLPLKAMSSTTWENDKQGGKEGDGSGKWGGREWNDEKHIVLLRRDPLCYVMFISNFHLLCGLDQMYDFNLWSPSLP